MAHQDELLIHTLATLGNKSTLAILCTPQLEELLLFLATTKQEYTTIRILLNKTEDYLLHQAWWIHLALVGGKWCDTNPLFKTLLGSEDGGQQVQISTLGREDGTEILDINRIAQTLEHSGIILER